MKAKKLKRFFSAVLVSALSMSLLAGCGGKSEEAATDENGATIIKFGIHVANPEEQEPVTYKIVEAFNKANEGKYKVEFEAADTETHSKNMKLKAEDGTLPQIFWIEGSEAAEYSEAGVLMDLTEFLDENAEVKEALGGMEEAFMITDSMDYLISVMFREFFITKKSLIRHRLHIRQTIQLMKSLLK